MGRKIKTEYHRPQRAGASERRPGIRQSTQMIVGTARSACWVAPVRADGRFGTTQPNPTQPTSAEAVDEQVIQWPEIRLVPRPLEHVHHDR